ncbi:MAG TPA: hypothetical protein VK578_18955 [Edaphobacter sp.]|nr:hypothetical protein [Edaphobacter sp.]
MSIERTPTFEDAIAICTVLATDLTDAVARIEALEQQVDDLRQEAAVKDAVS